MSTPLNGFIQLDALIKLATSTSGRRIYALRKVRALAAQYGLADLVLRIDQALVEDRETRALDNRWNGNTGDTIYGPDVPEVDNWVDQVVTSIRDGAALYTKGAFAGSPRQETAERFLRTAFPGGALAITSLPYIDQVAAVEALLDQLRGPLATSVSELGLDLLVARLGELAVEYRALVERDRERLTFPTVRAARKRGQRNLLGIIATILGTYHSHTDTDHLERRSALMQPIMEQDRAIRALLAERRAVADIDPDAPDIAPMAAADEMAADGEMAAAG